MDSAPSSIGGKQKRELLIVGPNSASAGVTICRGRAPLLMHGVHRAIRRLSTFPQIVSRFRFHGSLILQRLRMGSVPFQFSTIVKHKNLIGPVPNKICRIGRTVGQSALRTVHARTYGLKNLVTSRLTTILPKYQTFVTSPNIISRLRRITHVANSPLVPHVAV